MTARDYFEAAHHAAVELERTRAALMAMEARERASGSPVGARVSGGASDPMARTDARIDREAMWHRRIAEAEAVVDHATSVVYGPAYDGGGGIAKGVGGAYADVVYWRYLDRKPWSQVATEVVVSPRTARRMHDLALDYVDSVGIEGAIEGREV